MTKNNNSFVLFKLPNQNTFYYAEDDSNQKEIISFTSFLKDQKISIRNKKFQNLTYSEIIALEEKIVLLDLHNFKNHSKENFIDLLSKTIHFLQNSEASKIVISRKQIEDYTKKPVQHFKHICEKFPKAFCYLLYENCENCLIGASPELLIKRIGNKLETMALAGTLENSNKIVWAQKEIDEHQMVIDNIVGSLQKYSTKISIEDTKEVQLNKLKHLQTKIFADIKKNIKTETIISSLHPTSAVCGIPKETALRFINDNENYNREFYTGYIKLKMNKIDYAFVNLRCAKIYNNAIEKFIGGGILESSIPQKEWEETVWKSKVLDV